jgi:translocator protein
MKNILKLIVAIAVPLSIGALGSYFTIPEINDWYQTINKPAWNPPNWIFGPVWTSLYLLMGISLYLVWKSNTTDGTKTLAVSFFIIQLGLNFFWTIIFFNLHQTGWAVVEIMLLWVFILFTIFSFSSIHKAAPWLLVPYICWVSFAMILNYSIWQLNK